MRCAVIGGGILGRLLALELFERGESVTLFEKGPSDGSASCGYVGLGMISPWSELPNIPQDDFVTLRLGVESLAQWPHLLNKINSKQNYLNKGCLIIARREEYASISMLKKLLNNSQNSEFIDVCFDPGLRRGDMMDISQLELEISKNFFHGIFLPKEGCLDTRTLFVDLTNYFHKINLPAFYNCGEVDVEKFDTVIDTRGLGAKTTQNNLRGVRGETLRVFAPDVNISRLIRVLDSKLPLYIVPRGDSVYTLGATCIESEDTKPITVRSTLEMLSMARYVHEGFMEASILETNVQFRPAYLDNKIKIKLKNNNLSVNGLYRHGIMCAPALATLCANLLTENEMKIKINGVLNEFEGELNLENLLSAQQNIPQYFVVAHNYNCVSSNEYAQIKLNDGDEVEIVSPMQGG